MKFGAFMRLQDGVMVDGAMLVAHGGADAEHRAVMQRADHASLSMSIFGVASFLGKPQSSRPPAIGASSSRYIECT